MRCGHCSSTEQVPWHPGFCFCDRFDHACYCARKSVSMPCPFCRPPNFGPPGWKLGFFGDTTLLIAVQKAKKIKRLEDEVWIAERMVLIYGSAEKRYAKAAERMLKRAKLRLAKEEGSE
jgi:hypothetical protein